MERKLLEDEKIEEEEFDTNTGEVDQRIKETYVLKNFNFETPLLNYEYLNEEISVLNYTNISPENYDPKKSFESLTKVNKEIQRCNHEIVKITENVIGVFDTDEKLKDCNFYLGAEIIIMTNLYLFVVYKIGEILPEHIVYNLVDYTKHKYINMIMNLDVPDMNMIEEYLSIADSKMLKRLLKDTPKEMQNYKQYFEDLKNFNDFRNVLKVLNLTEARKLIVYFQNAVKYYSHIHSHYNKNLHNKGNETGSYYTKDIPKLLEVNDELSSEEQKVFLQDDEQQEKEVQNDDDKISSEEGFHVYGEGNLRKILHQYQIQMRQKTYQASMQEQQKQIVDNVKEDLEKHRDKSVNQADYKIAGIDPNMTIHESIGDLAFLSVLPHTIQSQTKGKKQRLSKREKKELKKQKRAELKAQKQMQRMGQNMNEKKEEIVQLQNQNLEAQTQNDLPLQVNQPSQDNEAQIQAQQQIQTEQKNEQQKKEDINTAINNTLLQLK